MDIAFSKWEGTGNDFIIVIQKSLRARITAEQAQLLCDRRLGIGADGILIITESRRADVGMVVINADGSKAAMCGNGLRCLAKEAYSQGIVNKQQFAVETKSGIKPVMLSVTKKGELKEVTTNLGVPEFSADSLLVASSSETVIEQPLDFANFSSRLSLLSLGNLHAVLFVDELADYAVEKVGPMIEQDKRFKERVNVEFVKVEHKNRLHQRTWERGVGETFSCGTGAAAAALAGIAAGKVVSPVTVGLKGGELSVSWPGFKQPVLVEGPAREVFRGEVKL